MRVALHSEGAVLQSQQAYWFGCLVYALYEIVMNVYSGLIVLVIETWRCPDD